MEYAMQSNVHVMRSADQISPFATNSDPAPLPVDVATVSPAKQSSVKPSMAAAGNMTIRSCQRPRKRGKINAADIEPAPKHASAIATSLSGRPRILPMFCRMAIRGRYAVPLN